VSAQGDRTPDIRRALQQIADADFASMEGVGSPFGRAVRERARLALLADPGPREDESYTPLAMTQRERLAQEGR